MKYFAPNLHDKVFTDDSQLENYRDEVSELQDEDIDVKVEKKFVDHINKSEYKNYPLVIKDIRKVYPGVFQPKVANKNITMRVNSGELFGLLGPNGAGKTTLIS